MDVGAALAVLESVYRAVVDSWPVFAGGLFGGLLLGVLLTWLLSRPKRRVARRSSFARELLALTPAVLACLLWGLWLGILAAKSLAR